MPYKDPERAREHAREYGAAWHQRNKERRLADMYRRKAEVYWYVQDLKAKSRCADCGIKHPAVLAFHHIKREDKMFSIGDAARRKLSLERVKKEISKCVLLCANCHAIRHWRERKSAERYSLAAGIAEAEELLQVTPAERDAYEKITAMFGTSGDPEQEYRDYQEYFGADLRNRE